MCMSSVAFVMCDLTCCMCGWSHLSRKADAFSVGPFVAETIGLTLSGSLCILGRKYIVCVSTLLGGASRVYWWLVMTPSFLHLRR